MNNKIEQKHVEQVIRIVEEFRKEISKVFVGQEDVVDNVITALITGGHILLEGVPGLGKTLLAKTIAILSGGTFNRVQFTPDLMPSDITGHEMYDMKKGEFIVRKGPVFCHILLADEINRTPAKTQAALLEAMQEKQVTIEGKSLLLNEGFLVIATQNPLEQEGTYPLPQSQTDRFMFKLHIGYPKESVERNIVYKSSNADRDQIKRAQLKPVVQPENLHTIRQIIAAMTVDDQIINYITKLVRATREWNGIEYGAGPRGSINLLRAARGAAIVAGRTYVTPDDVKLVFLPVLRHRIQLTADVELEGAKADDILRSLLVSVDAPRS